MNVATPGTAGSERCGSTSALGFALAVLGASIAAVLGLLITPAAGAQQPVIDPSITLVTNVTGTQDPSFDYTVTSAGGLNAQFTQQRGDSYTFFVPADTPISLSSIANGAWIPAMWCTGALDGLNYDDPSSDVEITLPAGADVTCTYEHTLDVAPRLFIVMNAPSDPNLLFTGSQGSSLLELRHGEAGMVSNPAGSTFGFDTWNEPLGWKFDVHCSGTAPLPTVIDKDYQVRIWGDFGAVGEVLTCIYDAEHVGIANVTFEIQADDPTLEVPILDGYRSRILRPTATTPVSADATAANLGFYLAQIPDGYDALPGGCTGTNDVSFGNVEGGRLVRSEQLLTGTPNPGDTITCTIVVADALPVHAWTTVTCLAGNGRIDVNVINEDDTAHEFTVTVGSLSPRVHTIAAHDWWRSPVTGRPDGPISILLQRGADVIIDRDVVVDCDDDTPTVSNPNITEINVCRGGLGFIAWQFSNPYDEIVSYIIEFDGVPNRSTSASPHGAAVRGVSGRPDGVYEYTIRSRGAVYRHTVTVDCS